MEIRAKLRWVVAFALIVSACGSPAALDTSTTGPTQRQLVLGGYADEVWDSLESLSLEFSQTPVAEDVDLQMAWTDLESDLRSVVNDLLREPGSVDTAGVQRRLESFGTMVHEAEDVALPLASWEEFMSSFSTFVEKAGSA